MFQILNLFRASDVNVQTQDADCFIRLVSMTVASRGGSKDDESSRPDGNRLVRIPIEDLQEMSAERQA